MHISAGVGCGPVRPSRGLLSVAVWHRARGRRSRMHARPPLRLHKSRSVCRANGALILSVHPHVLLSSELSPNVYGSGRSPHGQVAAHQRKPAHPGKIT